MKTVYYAHCMDIYDEPQETEDLVLLSDLGFRVFNPNNGLTQVHVSLAKEKGLDVMEEVFLTAVQNCDLLAFRAQPDGRLAPGVAKEIMYAADAGMPIVQVPTGMKMEVIPVREIQNHLDLIGKRK
jgi:hypothetical protein